MKYVLILLAFSFKFDTFNTGNYYSVPNFPSKDTGQYILSDADIKEMEKNSGDIEITQFKEPVISYSFVGYHIEDLTERKSQWQTEAKGNIEDIQIDEILTRKRLSGIIKLKQDKQFKTLYAAYILSESPKLYSLLQIYFPTDIEKPLIYKFADAFINHIYGGKNSLETRLLNPTFPDDRFFAEDVLYSSDSIRNYGKDKYSFDKLAKHLKEDSVAQIDKYFEYKARSRLSFLKPQAIKVSEKSVINYDFLLVYFVYLDWDKKITPGQKGELTRLLVTVFGYKGDVVHTIIDSIDDKKYNLNNDAFAKKWHQNRSTEYLSQRSPQYQKWVKKSKY